MPFEHLCHNGTRFYCPETHIGKADIQLFEVPANPLHLAADVAEAVGWWFLNIFQHSLNSEGFAGFSTLRYVIMTHRTPTGRVASSTPAPQWAVPHPYLQRLVPMGDGAMADCFTADYSEIEVRTLMNMLGNVGLPAERIEAAINDALFECRVPCGQARRAAITREVLGKLTTFCGHPRLIAPALLAVLTTDNIKPGKCGEVIKAVEDKLELRKLTRIINTTPRTPEQRAADDEVIRLVKEEFPPARPEHRNPPYVNDLGGIELQPEALDEAVTIVLYDCGFPGIRDAAVSSVFEQIEAKLVVVNDDRQTKSMPNVTRAVLTAAAYNALAGVAQDVGKPLTGNDCMKFANDLADELGMQETPSTQTPEERVNDDPANMKSEDKPKLRGLVRDDPATPEGKYLVKRRDGSVVEWPNWVLGARDPHAPAALRAYADSMAEDPDAEPELVQRLYKLADEFIQYRAEHGNGDPTRGLHRKDDPATVEEMKKGHSA